MTRVERQTMYLATFQALKEQAAGQVPPERLETWLGGGGVHVFSTGTDGR